MSYLVFIPSKRKPLLQTNDLIHAVKFKQSGYNRSIFDSTTGKQMVQGGVIAPDYKEWLLLNKAR